MDEEAMWKHFYEKMKEAETGAKTEHDVRIQELDGGFFERFGSLLRERTEEAASEEAAPLPDERQDDDEVLAEEPSAAQESDSEPEEPTDAAELLEDAMGWNIDELYSEVLYEILHAVGYDGSAEDERNALFNYLQEAFKLDDDKHNSLLERAKAKEAPNILLNVEIIEAKDLSPKDANGLSDPFCTLYLTSAVNHRYNTSVKTETLNPVWEEHFSLPVNDPLEDVLCIEVWDFDPAETVREKMMKFGEVKGVRGLRKLMKEIAVTASTGKHDNELVGSTQIPLKNLPAAGMTYWLPLEKRTKAKKQGEVKLRLAFSSEKNRIVAAQEHRHLVRMLLMHDVETSKVAHYHWAGPLPNSAANLLAQHRAQSALRTVDVMLARWVEYAGVHCDHPLSFTVFPPLLTELKVSLETSLLADDEVKMFWDSVKKILPSCLNAVRKIRRLTPSDKHSLTQLASILSIISQLTALQPPEGMDLLPSSVYGWLSNKADGPNCDILAALTDAVKQGAEDWFSHILENNNTNDSSDEGKLNHQIKLVQLVRTDLQKAVEFHDKIFQQALHFPYAKILYRLYEAKISELSEELVTEVCETLKPLKFNDNPEDGIYDNDPITMGTTLFELYLILQRFCVLGTGLCPGEADSYHIKDFHVWFRRGVAQWLDIALYKALQRIEKAVELDKLEPVDNTVKHSTSAVDTLTIFYQIKLFWQQLAWPDVEGSYTFVAKIIDDICHCSVFYADKMSRKVEGLGVTHDIYETKFQVTNEWCLAINNIEYVCQHISPFVLELGMVDILRSLGEFGSQAAAEHCRRTLQLVIDNAVETVANKILELLETVAHKMIPSINRFLLEGAELIHQDNNHVDRLMLYLDENLVTLHSQLSSDNFDPILAIIWEKLSHMMAELVEVNLEKRRPPSFFMNLHETLQMLVGFFRQSEGSESAVLKDIEHLLRVHGMETPELIYHYHQERLEEQRAMEAPTRGLLTVRCQRVEDLLRIEILNARNLQPMDSNGSCDPYVKVHLLPEEKFAGVVKPRTKTHKKNMFPLFDEVFTIHLTPEQQQVEDGTLQFVIKDQDFLGMNEFIAECFLHFSDIPKTDMTTGLEELEQTHLKLSRPSSTNSETYKSLESRHGDKLARDFIKREKTKFAPNNK